MPRLDIIDVSPFVYAGIRRPGLDKDYYKNIPVGGLEYLIRMMMSELSAYRDIAFCFDSRSFRKDIDGLYKSDRISDPGVRVQIDIFKEFLEVAGIPFFKADDFEADDLVYSVTQHYKYRQPIYSNIYIWGNDYDLLHNIDDEEVVQFKAMSSLVKDIDRYNYGTLYNGDLLFNTKTIRNVFLGDGDYKKSLELECGLKGRQLYNLYKDLVRKFGFNGQKSRDRKILETFLSKLPQLTENDRKQLNTRMDIFYPKFVEGLNYNVMRVSDKVLLEIVDMILALRQPSLSKTFEQFLTEFKLRYNEEVITKLNRGISTDNKYTKILEKYDKALSTGTYMADNNLTFNDVGSPYSVAFDDVF